MTRKHSPKAELMATTVNLAANTPDELMTPKEVCATLKIGLSTLYAWLRDGNFPQGRKINGTRRWTRAEVMSTLH